MLVTGEYRTWYFVLLVSFCSDLISNCSAFQSFKRRMDFKKVLTSKTGAIKHFPAEWEEHELCFMQWPKDDSFWKERVNDARKDLVGIALAVAQFEPVTLIVSPQDVNNAKKFFNSTSNVKLVSIPTDNLWARDTFPAFIKTGNQLSVANFNFNGWGDKQEHLNDNLIASRIADYLQIKDINSGLVAEGGAFETDGEGTLLITESSIVIDNRNPNKSRKKVDAALRTALGINKIIWFEGCKGEDITDSHIDGFVRFSSPGNVIVSKPYPPSMWTSVAENMIKVLQNETDSKGRKFTIVELPCPDPAKISGKGEAFESSYVNYFVANGAVIVPKFNHKEADDRAVKILGGLFPGRKVVQVEIDTIATCGGGIHCVTHELPKV